MKVLVLWDEFKNGSRSLDEFKAALNSTIDESWKLPWVQQYGNCGLAENACFPDSSPDGYGVYSTDLADKFIPEGAVQFPPGAQGLGPLYHNGWPIQMIFALG